MRAALAREWSSGRLLAARVPADLVPEGVARPTGTSFPFRVRLRGPTATELGSRFDDVQRWVAAHMSSTRYRVATEERASRSLGRQTLPVAAVVETDRDALDMLGRRREASEFDALVALTPTEWRWFPAAYPLKVLDIGEEWPAVLQVAGWLRRHPSPDVFVRQVDLPGVHTKLVERHRQTIASLVSDGQPPRVSTLRAFEHTYGFRSRPARVRYRALDPACAPVPGLVDVMLPVDELAQLVPSVRQVVVVENEICMLTFPAVAGGLVIWGSGNQAPELLSALTWLRDVEVRYWGDIDTHGFAILDRLRLVLPHVRSMLMDQATLLYHRDRWGHESEQTTRDLSRLDDEEAAVYGGLCADTWGQQVRLEQELLTYGAVTRAAHDM